MSESNTISVKEGKENDRETKEQSGYPFAFENILKTINANFELFLLIAVIISVLVASII